MVSVKAKPSNFTGPGYPRLSFMNNLLDLGIGIGLRVEYYQEIFESWPELGFFEIISENLW